MSVVNVPEERQTDDEGGFEIRIPRATIKENIVDLY